MTPMVSVHALKGDVRCILQYFNMVYISTDNIVLWKELSFINCWNEWQKPVTNIGLMTLYIEKLAGK